MSAVCNTKFDDLICCLLSTNNLNVNLRWVEHSVYRCAEITPTFRLFITRFGGEAKVVEGYTKSRENPLDKKYSCLQTLASQGK